MDTFSKFMTPEIVFLLTLVFGVWLSLACKPYNGILFNIHKLIALGAVIATAMQLYKILENTDIHLYRLKKPGKVIMQTLRSVSQGQGIWATALSQGVNKGTV